MSQIPRPGGYLENSQETPFTYSQYPEKTWTEVSTNYGRQFFELLLKFQIFKDTHLAVRNFIFRQISSEGPEMLVEIHQLLSDDFWTPELLLALCKSYEQRPDTVMDLIRHRVGNTRYPSLASIWDQFLYEHTGSTQSR